MDRPITKAALILFREVNGSKELMLVRASNKPYFVMPGGKLEPEESPEEALQRELMEELGTTAENLKYLGKVHGNTPDGREIEEHMYLGTLAGEPTPQAEIVEIAWLSRNALLSPRNDLTPLTLEKILPFIDAQQLW
jgi:8-oxo-dGTP diphosphatase